MQLEFSLFAEAADVTERGMLNLLGGGIDVIKGPMFPAPLHSLFVIAKVITTPDETGLEHDFCTRVSGPDGAAITADVHVKFMGKPHPRNPKRNNWAMLTVHYQCLVIPGPGDYIFQFSGDGKRLGENILEAVRK